MRNTTRWAMVVLLSGVVCSPLMAEAGAEKAVPISRASATLSPFATTAPAEEAATTQPSVHLLARNLPDLVPAGTLLYMGWPGIAELSESMGDTALAKLMAEPEMAQLREQFMPAMDRFIRSQMDDDEQIQVYSLATGLLQEIWNHPTTVSIVGVGMGQTGPAFDAALLIRAGRDAERIQQSIEQIFQAANPPPQMLADVEVQGFKLRELQILGPNMPIRWGTIQQHVILTIGTRTVEHLTAAETTGSLGQDEDFAAAMKAIDGNAGHPTMFLDIKGLLATVKTFEPMLAMFQVPVIGQPGTIERWMESMGLGNARSVSMVCKGNAGGWQTDTFLHSPGLDTNPHYAARKPVVDADLACIPKEVTTAWAAQVDLLREYTDTLALLDAIMPMLNRGGDRPDITGAIAAFEQRHNINLVDDLIEPFGDTWVAYDMPAAGGLWFTGITAVAKVDNPDRLQEGLRGLVRALADEANAKDSVTLVEQRYRGQKITFVNVAGVPMPFAPAWAQVEERWVFGLFPQMVRVGIDQLLDKKTSLLDNPDFQRARKLLPQNASGIQYSDTQAGMRTLYSFALPIAQLLLAMGQGEGLTLDASILPSLPTINRHMFGHVAGMAVSDQGYLVRQHGPLPAPIASAGVGAVAASTSMSIMLPSLARARQLSKRSVSAANLKGIGLAMFAYANENNDVFPPDLETLIREGLISRQTLISPLDPDNEQAYIYIPGQTADVDPNNILVYEDPANAGGEGGTALFADGHVEWLKLKQLLEQVEQTRNRVGDTKLSPDEQLSPEQEEEAEQERQLPAGQL